MTYELHAIYKTYTLIQCSTFEKFEKKNSRKRV